MDILIILLGIIFIIVGKEVGFLRKIGWFVLIIGIMIFSLSFLRSFQKGLAKHGASSLSEIWHKNLSGSRINANENHAQAACEAIYIACEAFRRVNGVYPNSLETLGLANPPYLPMDLAKGKKQGYIFVYQLSEDGQYFTLDAYPEKVGMTGKRQFSVNENGEVLGIYLQKK